MIEGNVLDQEEKFPERLGVASLTEEEALLTNVAVFLIDETAVLTKRN
jgi:hypothetical protein